MSKKFVYFSIAIFILAIFTITISVYLILNNNVRSVDKTQLNKDTENVPSVGNENAKFQIVEFMDFKCSYCKKFNNKNFKYLKNKYIDKRVANFRIVNVSILGDDSIRAASAANAIYEYSPGKYLEFHDNLFDIQNEDKKITFKLLDKEIDKLNIPQSKLEKIKMDYKNENSKFWLQAKKDQKLFEKYKLESVPSVFVNGKMINDPYSKREFDEIINE